jgi:hypothetical protein
MSDDDTADAKDAPVKTLDHQPAPEAKRAESKVEGTLS